MKLPEDKKERAKIIILILVGVAGVMYAGFQLILTHLVKPKKAKSQKIQMLKDRMKTMNIKINMMPGNREKNRVILMELKDISNDYMLEPRLGEENFRLHATELVEGYFRNLKMEMAAPLQEMGLSEIDPGARKVVGIALRTYNIRLTAGCGYHDLIRLVREVETSNPYLCVTGIEIVGRSTTKEEHSIRLSVQWPW